MHFWHLAANGTKRTAWFLKYDVRHLRKVQLSNFGFDFSFSEIAASFNAASHPRCYESRNQSRFSNRNRIRDIRTKDQRLIENMTHHDRW